MSLWIGAPPRTQHHEPPVELYPVAEQVWSPSCHLQSSGSHMPLIVTTGWVSSRRAVGPCVAFLALSRSLAVAMRSMVSRLVRCPTGGTLQELHPPVKSTVLLHAGHRGAPDDVGDRDALASPLHSTMGSVPLARPRWISARPWGRQVRRWSIASAAHRAAIWANVLHVGQT